MRPMGGVLGGIVAWGGAVEHQGVGTPHFHCEVHVVCAYQYGTLEEIASKIKDGMLDPEAVKRYQAWLHAEDILDKEEYDKFRPRVEAEWQQRFAAEEHHTMSVTPAYLQEEAQLLSPPNVLTAVSLTV